MRLKRLKIFGFKSFADVSTIDFIDGVTAVVGPNGCGKSNIADAFRWVLGEQSAKSLRGRSMPDVIFAGTTTRKPVNYAEVSLTLSEVNGQLPIDYDEVTVTRRLHRSGESEYFLNAHPVRYREIQSLFMDSGIGRSAFSIFEQGKIDQVINLSPVERRYLFEEAAGILRFLQRKKEALRKLEETELNMERLDDLQGEVLRQVEVLGRQAEAAKDFKAKKCELEALQKAVLCARWSWLDFQFMQLQDKENAKAESATASQVAVEEGQRATRQAREALTQAEHRLALQRQEIVKVQTTIEHTVEGRRKHQERLDEALTSQNKREKDLVEVLTSRSVRREEIASCEARLEELKDRVADAQHALARRRQQFAVQEERVTSLYRQQQQLQQEQLKQVQAEAKVEGDLGRAMALLNASQQRLTTCEVEREGVLGRINSLDALATQRQEALENAGHKVEAARDRLEGLMNSVEEYTHRCALNQEQLSACTTSLTEWQARHDVLEQLRSAGEGLGSGAKKLLEEARRNDSSLFGKLTPLYELISPKKGYERLLATALQRYNDTLAVNTVADLHAVLAFATRENLQGFSLFCMEASPSETPIQTLRVLVDVCDGAAGKQLLKSVVVEEDLGVALDLLRNHTGITICNSAGFLIDSSHVVMRVEGGSASSFLREAELRDLLEEIDRASARRDELTAQRLELIQRKNICEVEANELKEQLRRGEVSSMEANYAWQQAVSDLGKARAELERIQVAAKEAEVSTKQMLVAVEECRQQLSQAKNMSEMVADRLFELEEQAEEVKGSLRAEKMSLQEDETAFERITDENRWLSHTLSLLAVKDHESQIQEKRLEAEIRQAKELQDRLLHEEQDNGSSLDAVEKRLERLLEAQTQTEDEVVIGRQRVHQFEQETEAEAGRLKRREKELHEIGIQKAQQTSLLEAYALELKETYQINAAIERENLPELESSLPEAEQRLKALKEEVELAANVNMTSIDEYDAQKMRAEGLGQQLHDLKTSQKGLQQIIAELDEESRRLFSTTFATIRTKFQEIFQILFRGGEADLCLTDEGDVLSAGIEIIAKPPGKQMRSIHLMSGGEKCLTALALLFALFEVKPSPFCLLDEIDAPLDDSNVGRFSAMLKHFVDRCQFIVITHNKCTMAVADVLVGVSMQEKGVSKVLTFDFAHHEVALTSS